MTPLLQTHPHQVGIDTRSHIVISIKDNITIVLTNHLTITEIIGAIATDVPIAIVVTATALSIIEITVVAGIIATAIATAIDIITIVDRGN